MKDIIFYGQNTLTVSEATFRMMLLYELRPKINPCRDYDEAVLSIEMDSNGDFFIRTNDASNLGMCFNEHHLEQMIQSYLRTILERHVYVKRIRRFCAEQLWNYDIKFTEEDETTGKESDDTN